MAVPKRKQSHARTNKRRSNNSKLTAPTMVKCSKCGAEIEVTVFESVNTDFAADIANIWAQFFFAHYGRRGIKVRDENGIWYLYSSCGMVYWTEDFVTWKHKKMERTCVRSYCFYSTIVAS